MSKTVELDHEFDKNRFTELLNKAQGGRTQTEFAKDCNLSTAYMCKCLNGKYRSVPIPSTIKKIAANSLSGVTYSELLEAAGYDSSKYLYTDTTSNDTNHPRLEFKKIALATVTSALSNCNFSWTIAPRNKQFFHDLELTISDGELSSWAFHFLYGDDIMENLNTTPKRLLQYYGLLAMSKSKSSKFSLVTSSVDTFNKILECEPSLLATTISVILIDCSKMQVLKEEYLNSYKAISPDFRDIYSLNKQK